MAIVHKCDICGAVYEGRPDKYLYGNLSTHIAITDMGDYGKDTKTVFEHYDLCQDCVKRVRVFLQGMTPHDEATKFETTSKPHRKWRLFPEGS